MSLRSTFQACVLVGAAFGFGGCVASITGKQVPLKPGADLTNSVCPSATQVNTFNGLTAGTARRDYRDEIVMQCVKAINRNYEDFKQSLHREGTGTNLTTDLLALALTTGASVSKGAAAKNLAAGGAFFVGAGTAVNKDIFYQQTLPAIEASMDSKRYTILTGILNSEKGDPDASKYTLTNAGFDLDAYESAGNIYLAISELNKTTATAADKAKTTLEQSQNKPYAVTVLDSTVYGRFTTLTSAVWKLTDTPANRATLLSISKSISYTLDATQSFDDQKADVTTAMDVWLRSKDPAAQIGLLEGYVATSVTKGS